MLPEGPWRRGLLAAAGLSLAGCASPVEVRPLATGRVDVDAFELRGAALADLRREALRRCPQGAEVLRQAESGRVPSDTDSGQGNRWLNLAASWVDPPQRQAQILVLCKADAQRLALVSPALPATAAPPESVARHRPPHDPRRFDGEPAPFGGDDTYGPATGAPASPSPPIGPIDPSW